MKNKYTVVALFGEAGAGKDTLLDALADAHPEWHKIISCTTRPMREGEEDGINYYYLTEEEFERKIVYAEMVEVQVFRGWYYGTAYSCLKENEINIGVFNINGIVDLMQAHLNGGFDEITVIPIRVSAPAKVRILRQLNREENPDVHEICRRFLTDDSDFASINFNYDSIDNSGPIDGSLGQIEKILGQKLINDKA